MHLPFFYVKSRLYRTINAWSDASATFAFFNQEIRTFAVALTHALGTSTL